MGSEMCIRDRSETEQSIRTIVSESSLDGKAGQSETESQERQAPTRAKRVKGEKSKREKVRVRHRQTARVQHAHPFNLTILQFGGRVGTNCTTSSARRPSRGSRAASFVRRLTQSVLPRTITSPQIYVVPNACREAGHDA